MREDYSFFGGASLVFGGLAFALSFDFRRVLFLDNFTLKYGGLFLALVGIVILVAGIGTKKAGFPDDPVGEELGVIRDPPKN